MVFAKRVHRLPEASMNIGNQLAVFGQMLHRLSLQDGGGIVAKIGPDGWAVADHVSAVDQPLGGLWFLIELDHAGALELHLAETARRPNSGYGDYLALLAMEIDELRNVDVRDAVAVRQQKQVVVLHVPAHARNASPGRRLLTRLR